MSEPDQQGLFSGSRCLAALAGQWAPATVRRVNEDGTFKIEFDAKQLVARPPDRHRTGTKVGGGVHVD
jgi:hypothetical protein